VNRKYIIALIFILSLVIRLFYVFIIPHDIIVGDSYSWIKPAEDILDGKGYNDTKRGPIYPLIITVLYSIFGFEPLVITIFQSLVSSLNCILIYIIAEKIFSPMTGIITAVLVCFYPYLIFYTGVVISETVYTFLISLTVLFIIYAKEKDRIYQWIFAGISFGLTALCKPVILVFLLFVFLWIYLTTQFKLYALINIFILGLFTLLTVLPWTIRNYFFYKKIIFISTGGADFWLSNNDTAMVLETTPEIDEPAPERWIWFPKERYEEIKKLPITEADKIFWKEGINWIKNNPDKFSWLVWCRLIHFWRLWPKMATKKNKLIAKLTSGVYFPLALIGIIFSYKKYWEKTLLLIFLFVSFTLAYLPFYCMIRYRIPIDPLILVFTGYSITLFIKIIYEKSIIRKEL